MEYDTHFLKDNENQVNYADCDIKEPTEVRTERHTKVIKLPATFVGDAHVVNIDRLCEILDGWCTFDTYKFLKSHDFKDSSESGGKLFHNSFINFHVSLVLHISSLS